MSTPHASGDFVSSLRAALASGESEAFVDLLADDVRWGGEHGGDACTSRAQAGDHYAALLSAGVALHLDHVSEPSGDGTLIAGVQITSPDGDMLPAHMTVRLTVRYGLIAEILELDPPPIIELLYFDGCPHYAEFLPHLRRLLDHHNVTAPIALVRIDGVDDAVQRRFLGSPTLRVNGRDVDPSASARVAYGLQCRLYTTPEGVTGAPADQWILDSLIANPRDETAIDAENRWRGRPLSC